MLQKIIEALQGKKTYIVMGLSIVIAILQILGIHIPAYVWTILGSLGLGGVRSAINKVGSPKN